MAGRARAEEGPEPVATVASTEHPVALATNLPFRWPDADSIAASLYVGVTEHHAIRANVASYKEHGHVVGSTIGLLAGGDGEEVDHHGRITDLGVALVYFPRRVLDGLMLEAGVLRRARDVGSYDEFRAIAYDDQDTTTYAAHGLIGWSWLIYGRSFIATGIGLSVGHETGTETLRRDYPSDMTSSHHLSRLDVTGEAYLRIGIVFAL